MKIPFYKYHGCGNDFVVVDNRERFFPVEDTELIAMMCHRRFGIGADGLILLQNHEKYDFEMVYYNADGNLSSFCGNGSRCIVHFAAYLGIIKEECDFLAVDGIHHAHVLGDDMIKVEMRPVGLPELIEGGYCLDTGSPHFVKFIDDWHAVDVVDDGRKIRNSEPFAKEGINVNFIKKHADHIDVATYERGVEDETLACGTGVTACALVTDFLENTCTSPITVNAKGGALKVYFHKSEDRYQDIWLEGAAKMVFTGVYDG